MQRGARYNLFIQSVRINATLAVRSELASCSGNVVPVGKCVHIFQYHIYCIINAVVK